MPRTRSRRGTSAKSTAAKSGAATETTSASTFTCPECGKSFTRAASLGAHRRRAHGIVGSSAAARKAARGRRRVVTPVTGGNNPSAPRTTRRPPAATAARGSGRPRRSASVATSNGVNRDALLTALFPAGIPPREDVIRSVNAWLDEAERLASIR